MVSPEVARSRVDDLIDQLARSEFLVHGTGCPQPVQSGGLFQLLDKSESLKLDIYQESSYLVSCSGLRQWNC